MTFAELLEQVRELLQSKGRVSYRALKLQFNLDEEHLEGLKDELIEAERVAADEDGKVLVWIGNNNPESRVQSLNQSRRDWHRDAHADRSRVVTSLDQPARSCCAATYDSGDFPCRASPHASRIAARPVWIPVGPASFASVRYGPDPERSGQRAVLLALQRVPDRASIPGRHAHLRGGQRAKPAAKTATLDALAQTLGAGAAQDRAPSVGLVSHAVEPLVSTQTGSHVHV